jgi:hypothetical protein
MSRTSRSWRLTQIPPADLDIPVLGQLPPAEVPLGRPGSSRRSTRRGTQTTPWHSPISTPNSTACRSAFQRASSGNDGWDRFSFGLSFPVDGPLENINLLGREEGRPRTTRPTATTRSLARRAFYHALEKHLADATSGQDVRADAAEGAEAMLEIIQNRRVVNWAQREDIQNEMRNDLDDYLFDVMRDQKGLPLTPAIMDDIIDRTLSIARTRLPD